MASENIREEWDRLVEEAPTPSLLTHEDCWHTKEERARRALASHVRELRQRVKNDWFRQIQLAAWFGFLHAIYLYETEQMEEWVEAGAEERDKIYAQQTWQQVEHILSRLERRYFGHFYE